MTTTEPAGTVSTKWVVNVGADVSDASTILTVYAGPQMRVEEEDSDATVGDIMWMSGKWPP